MLTEQIIEFELSGPGPLGRYMHRRSQGGGPGGPPNQNSTNDKKL